MIKKMLSDVLEAQYEARRLSFISVRRESFPM